MFGESRTEEGTATLPIVKCDRDHRNEVEQRQRSSIYVPLISSPITPNHSMETFMHLVCTVDHQIYAKKI